MSCVKGILPIVGFFFSLILFSYIFLDKYIYNSDCLVLGVILVITSSFLILTFSIIKYLQCKRTKTPEELEKENDKEKNSTCQDDKECFMKLWDAAKDSHIVLKVLYYGTLMPVVIFVGIGLFLGMVIYFASGILIFYLIISYCINKKKKPEEAKKSKYEEDSEMDISKSKK